MASQLPSTMRAAQWTTTAGGIEKNMKLNSSAPLPKNAGSLPPKSTLVKVAYSSLNPIDYKVPESLAHLFMTKPGVPGLDYSGTVVDSTLPNLKPGMKVFGVTTPPAFGALAEYLVVVGENNCVPVPEGVDMKQASCAGTAGITSYQCIVPFTQPGNRILINGGSGGTGSFGLQIAKAHGLEIVTTCSTANVQLCKDLGADEVIDYRQQDIIETLKKSPKQFDLIVDNVFKTGELYVQSHHFLRPGGKYITIAGGPNLDTVTKLLKVYLTPSFLGGGKRDFKFLFPATKAEDYSTLAQWMREGKLKIPIEDVMTLDQAGAALGKVKIGRTKGKIVVEVSGEPAL